MLGLAALNAADAPGTERNVTHSMMSSGKPVPLRAFWAGGTTPKVRGSCASARRRRDSASNAGRERGPIKIYRNGKRETRAFGGGRGNGGALPRFGRYARICADVGRRSRSCHNPVPLRVCSFSPDRFSRLPSATVRICGVDFSSLTLLPPTPVETAKSNAVSNQPGALND